MTASGIRRLAAPLLVGCFVSIGLAPALAPSAAGQADVDEGVARRTITSGTHARLVVPDDVQRVALGDDRVLDVELISNREVLILGRDVGQSSVTVWFTNGAVRQYLILVQRDLSVLQDALLDIYATLRVQAAPDRDAVILRGEVPDASYSVAAESAARSYLEAGGAALRGSEAPLLSPSPAPESGVDGDPAAAADPASPGIQRPGELGRGTRAAVINLIRVRQLPETLERRLEAAVRRVGGPHLRVRRLVRGDLPSDADSFVLEGRVPTQSDLTRALSVAARLLGETSADLARSVRVLGDEGGGLLSSSRGAGTQNTGSLGGIGGGSTTFEIETGDLSNRIRENVARATALELLGGRLLSFVTVEDLPQVRVNVRLYEVNRTRLRSWEPNGEIIFGNIDQGSLLPTIAGARTQGGQAPRLGGSSGIDFQNALSLLSGGLVNQFQIAGARYAIDLLFELLAEQGIARSLANPTVMVLSGEIATVQVGGELPVPSAVVASAGNQVFESIEFVSFGVQLGIRPLVGPGDMITIDLVPQVVQPDPRLTASIRETSGTDQTTTAFESRSVRTTARLADGEALAIGGLLSRQISDARAFTPWLHRIPGLGWLGQSFEERDEDLELVVVVTPSILRERDFRVALWEFPDGLELLPAPSAAP